jgi:5-methylcytosine-specific restriction endonuclease McrA
MISSKKCHVCKQVKPVSDFYTSAGHNDGYQSRCKPCEKKYQKERRHLYAERNERYRKQWRKDNQEHVREVDREYRANNKEIWAAKERRRRAKARNNPTFYVSAKELKKLYASVCAYCGSEENITLDHVVPIQLGGAHSIGNLLPACGSCNFSKGQRLLIQWKKITRENAKKG